jgi:hypothetical protein
VLTVVYSVEGRWKERLVYCEDGREFDFDCAWGVDPYVVYVPTADLWDRVTPEWMHGRRNEILTRLREEGTHQTEDNDTSYS